MHHQQREAGSISSDGSYLEYDGWGTPGSSPSLGKRTSANSQQSENNSLKTGSPGGINFVNDLSKFKNKKKSDVGWNTAGFLVEAYGGATTLEEAAAQFNENSTLVGGAVNPDDESPRVSAFAPLSYS